MPMVDVKICGLKDPSHLDVAATSGARFAGLVFYPKSPRYIDPELARLISRAAPTGLRMVGLFVDPDDATLDRVLAAVPLDMIQLHGSEPPARVAAIKARYHLPVIKAIPVATRDDLAPVPSYEQVADWLLFDAKAPATATLPGGNGRNFDWSILRGKSFARPWMLSGGLTADNVGDALSLLRPDAVDVSSGVEKEPGHKDPLLIKAFITNVRGQ